MKNFFSYTLVLMLLTACGVSKTTSTERGQRQRAINETVATRDYWVVMTACHPLRMADRTLESGYDIHVKGDTLYSVLPYFGRAWSVSYGGGSALRFDAPIANYEAKRDKEGTRVSLRVSHGNDTFHYLLYIYDNGKATLDVSCVNRDNISFTGFLAKYEEEQ